MVRTAHQGQLRLGSLGTLATESPHGTTGPAVGGTWRGAPCQAAPRRTAAVAAADGDGRTRSAGTGTGGRGPPTGTAATGTAATGTGTGAPPTPPRTTRTPWGSCAGLWRAGGAPGRAGCCLRAPTRPGPAPLGPRQGPRQARPSGLQRAPAATATCAARMSGSPCLAWPSLAQPGPAWSRGSPTTTWRLGRIACLRTRLTR